MREKNAHRNFASESTNHFKVQFDGYEHGRLSRTVIGVLEDAYSQIGRDLDYYPSEPITVILYTNQDFRDVTQAPGWAGGYFDLRDGKIRVPVRGAEGKEALLRTVLFHEYVHALIFSIAGSAPAGSMRAWPNTIQRVRPNGSDSPSLSTTWTAPSASAT